ncbi:hypothetical protein BDB01DRAFT_800803 [Pilobolus umbonatus]|nr:hypothetical protein BDB01DRAFT_800803 [Pilobolus umbonatus]
MKRLYHTIDRTPEYNAFIKELSEFHELKGTTLQAEPVLGGRRLDLYKIFQVVTAAGGFEEVTRNRGWKQVGDSFDFPSTCTNSAYIIKGVYIRNLLGWEEEKLWNKVWEPPQELLGPKAHKITNLAGKAYRSPKKKLLPKPIQRKKRKEEHIHSSDPFTTERILFALQIGQPSDIEWALDHIVGLSFECPEIIKLDETPLLLNLLLSTIQPCLTEYASGNALPTSSHNLFDILEFEEDEDTEAESLSSGSSCSSDTPDTSSLTIILKILHSLRNFSFLDTYVPLLVQNNTLKEVLIQSLHTSMTTGHIELGRHAMDTLENMAKQVQLIPDDPYLQCIYQLIKSHDRYLIIGSIRTLTFFSLKPSNYPFLTSDVLHEITPMLLSKDEELIGTVLDYLYQFTFFSDTSILLKSSTYLGWIVSLLMTQSKYFCSRIIQATNQSPPLQSVEPYIPDLTDYQSLDEPYRCLGWLKDKFELADPKSKLSLDDMYLLYESRFGLEKALKMKNFYTVLKIAFPTLSISGTTPIVEGLNIYGIQIKMNILQEVKDVPCQWIQCTQSFENPFLLSRHLLNDHKMSPHYPCHWLNCFDEFKDEDKWTLHVTQHVDSPKSDKNTNGIALMAVHLLNRLSQDPSSAYYLIPYVDELSGVGIERPPITWTSLIK